MTHWHVYNQFIPKAKSRRFDTEKEAVALFDMYASDLINQNFRIKSDRINSIRVELDENSGVWLRIDVRKCKLKECE